MKKNFARKVCFIYILVCLLVSSCAWQNTAPSPNSSTNATPTVAPFFADIHPHTQSTTPSNIYSATQSASPTRTVSTNIPVSTRITDQIQEISIYDDLLSSDWSLSNSDFTQFEQTNQIKAQHGQTALAVKPLKAFGSLFFTVNKNTGVQFLRKSVLGFRLWLMGGRRGIATSDLAITVTGSNSYNYWKSNDTSVTINTPITLDRPLFSETRLYDLDINRTIPEGTWVEVVVWLDNLKYDPEYTYITGIYLKNDELFNDTFYLDNVDILLETQP